MNNAEKYAKSVVSGKIPAPKYVKLQCKEFLKIASSKDKKYCLDRKKLEMIEEILKMLVMPRGLKSGESIYDCSCGYQSSFNFVF